MAYVPGFRHDLYISCASDNFDLRMERFIEDLRAYLAPELGRLFTDGLAHAIRKGKVEGARRGKVCDGW